MADVRFVPVVGTEQQIKAEKQTDGQVYFATDTHKIYLDTEKDNKLPMGGAGNSGIYYGTKELTDEEKELEEIQFTLLNDIEGEELPSQDDLVLNADGCFYRVILVDIKNKIVTGSRLTVAGSGGGGGSSQAIRPIMTLQDIENPVIVNGQPFELKFVVKSALEGETPLANKLTVNWSLIDADTEQVYYQGTAMTVEHDKVETLKLGEYLKNSTNTIIQLQATGINHEGPSAIRQASVSTVEMYVEQTSRYSPTFKYDSTNVSLECNAIGNLSKILEWSVDGGVVETTYLNASSTNPQTFSIPQKLATHGSHLIEINLYQNLGDSENPRKGIASKPLKYEIAIVENGNFKPIIWLGDYQEVYYNYDTIQIPIMVYDPANTSKAEIHLYKNDIDINDGEPITITSFDDYFYWQIADADLEKQNYYSVSCGKTDLLTAKREIQFLVTKDPNRDMTVVKPNSLLLNFNPAGRTNNEPPAKRASWTYERKYKDPSSDNILSETMKAKFENFNWYNNGWYTDSQSKSTYLRISNGAKFTIPFKDGLQFATSTGGKQSNAIEIAFKVRNIQNYSNLISNVTRYNIPTEQKADGTWNYISDNTIYNNFLNQDKYDNYDAYLQVTLDPVIYENLDYREVQKDINLTNAVFGFYSGSNKSAVGACLGTQDAFFSNGFNTVSVPFVENEMVYLSFVYDHSASTEIKSKLYIYINGCITGVIASSISGDTGFKIASEEIVFDSSVCDIDLYSFRIYNTALTVNDIVTNHAVDKKDIVIYDQNKLAVENQTLAEFQLNFKEIEKYIKEHPEIPLMPYIIYDTSMTTEDDKLPYAKANGATDIRVEFVNVPLDQAYARGELVRKAVEDGLLDEFETDQDVINEKVRLYYKHHCPSWTSTMSSGDIVGIEVQGTSSEFYPRRNFKIKTKHGGECCWGDLEDDDGNVIGQGWTEEECLNIFMNRGPYEDIFEEDRKKLKEDEHYYGYEESRMFDGWYMNNYTNPTDRWTMKVDYMESSGSYNAAFASLVGNAYTAHPLKDYVDAGVLTNTDKLKNDVFKTMRWEDYRTSLLGFPVMAFHKKKKKGASSSANDEDRYEYVFIGYYRMLLDKGSDQVLGFKTNKKIEHTLVDNKRLRDVAECWEFSTNARTFCSYKDPWNRVELSFKGPKSIGDDAFIKLEGDKIGGPVVLNHFEPRYFAYEDYLKNDEDGFYNFGNLEVDQVKAMCEDIGIPVIDINSDNAKYEAQDGAVYLMRNWEKVCKWIYSTNLDNVKSQGTYSAENVGLKEYVPGVFYVLDENNIETGYSVSNDPYDKNQTYFEKVSYEVEVDKLDEDGNPILDDEGNPEKEIQTHWTFANAYATTADLIYKENTFYIYVSGAYSLCEQKEFDTSTTYYVFKSLSNDEIAEIADLLVAPATGYDSNTIYYTYNPDAQVNAETGITGAVVEIGKVSQEDYNKNNYYVAAPKTYGNTTYNYDTKEYRTAKFINELKDHFNLEYLATYFIMTEVFECYDSRGKNCMMASWGPLKEGGEYIWYPIFYDIDTQLGINNTGIPSFEFNVDATEAGNYSTSDSILWNNFYKFFKGSQILNKYKNLRNQDSSYDKLKNPPLQSVDYLEKWYTFEEGITKNIANRGKRPLIATNLDMFYKYITITNPKAESQGVAYIPGADGVFDYDRDGTYFYALQGDRSQSRRQFLTNRLEYIDSWLNQGNYQRGGSNRIRGRISANSGVNGKTSDWWVETENDPYWKDNEFGTKSHDFDAEYWLNLKPIRSAYVTAGDDSANYPSKKYDGKKNVNFKLSDIETGVRKSENYPEQLVYIYGMNQMADFGDLNKLYWTEFYMEGNADHLTRLQLGYDGESQTDPGKTWYNQKLNGIKLSTMPLLKEANFSNIGLDTQQALDLSASEKLENFRAVGTSNLTEVKFADGVSLNTLYLPKSITSLKLVQANLLTNVIDESTPPRPINNEDGTVSAPTQGLYIDGLFDESDLNGNPVNSSNLTSINFDGGSLGYGSYKILKKYYDTIDPASSTLNRITMKDVNWCPYVQLTDGDIYNQNETNYYLNDKHYGFKSWTKDASKFNDLVLNGQLYLYKGESEVNIGNDFLEMIQSIQTDKKDIFADASSSEEHPILTGIVYINNNNYVEESWIRNTLQPMYPNMTFFFKNVTQAYSAEFLYKDPETGVDKYVKFINGDTSPSVQKISKTEYAGGKTWFDNPFNLYKPERTHYDFIGWSENPNAQPGDSSIITESAWSNLTMNTQKYDYIYYAIFDIHKYDITFHDGDGNELETIKVPYGKVGIPLPSKVPYKDDSQLDELTTYTIAGYTDNTLTNKLVDLSTAMVRNNAHYYPIFEEINVYDNFFYIDNIESYFNINDVTHSDSYDNATYGITGKSLILKNGVVLKGKITLPTIYENLPIVTLGGFKDQVGITHVYFQKRRSKEDLINNVTNEIRALSSSCFFGCLNLKIFEWPSNLRNILNEAFINCKKLTSSRIPSKVAFIGQGAFAYSFAPDKTNPNSVDIYLPSELRNISRDAFAVYTSTEGGNKVIDKLYLGSSESDILKNTPENIYIHSSAFDVTTINQVVIYCSSEDYQLWGTEDARSKFPEGVKFSFPCQEIV